MHKDTYVRTEHVIGHQNVVAMLRARGLNLNGGRNDDLDEGETSVSRRLCQEQSDVLTQALQEGILPSTRDGQTNLDCALGCLGVRWSLFQSDEDKHSFTNAGEFSVLALDGEQNCSFVNDITRKHDGDEVKEVEEAIAASLETLQMETALAEELALACSHGKRDEKEAADTSGKMFISSENVVR